MIKRIFLCVICALFLLPTFAQEKMKAQPIKSKSGIHYEYMDPSVNPGDDFFKYATGNWIKHNPQPPIYPMWGSFTKLDDDNTKAVAGIIQDIAKRRNKPGTIEQKIGDLYNMAMDSARLNREGAAPLLAEIARIKAVQSRDELFKYLTREHDNLLWSLYIGVDDKNASQHIVSISQGGLSMGNRDYYVSKDPEIVKIRKAAIEHYENLFKLCGYSAKQAKKNVKTIWAMETKMAKVSYSIEQMRDPEANYHKMTVAELSKSCNNFDWATYLRNYGYDRTSEVLVGQPEPVALGCDMMMKESLENLKLLYIFRAIQGAAPYLSDDFIAENFAYNSKISGAKEMTPRWQRSVDLVSGFLNDAVGQMYVKKYFPPEAKTRMLELVKNLQISLGERIKAQTWMSEETKRVALDKLNAYYVKIGYPDKWEDLSKLVVDPRKSLYENIIEASRFYFELDKQKNYNKPVDRDEWHMPAQMVNAYYNPTTNEICFPAGILQPPFFDMKADDATNYGAIGVVIGHEMTHGFDDQGSQYDKDGNLKTWWAESDVKAFKLATEKMAVYFDSLWVIPGQLHSNGRQCLGENIADHGGLNVAYDALQMAQKKHGRLPDENGFTPEQRFFLSFANVWAGVSSDEILRYLTINDVHSVNYLRVNGGLSQCEYWYKAFNIQPTNKLYVEPSKRVDIW
ncbi:MAG: M13 family metallopeptidase [Bacteroidales bacterium]|nr:M13 family metallopeptidase [Bacteroidales bacterium]